MKVALGQFKFPRRKLTRNMVGTVNRQVASYKIHPDYMHTKTGDSDLAIVILKTPVELNPFIKPICLWSGSTTLPNIVGRTGYAVGWTVDKQKRLNFKEPRMVRVPIVSQETCLRSHEHFITFTSERIFCGDVGAGLLDENGPCFGDIGSGLVLFDNSTEATCLNWNKTSDIDPNILKVALGQFKLLGTNTIVGTVNRNVASYRIHPNSDLAILILETPVEFSPFIRPICLWSGSTNLENVVDRTGYVVGWAKELYKYKNKQIVIHRIMVSEPRMLRIPIRSQETCLWNHQSLGFSRWSRHNHTLERNFCAGLLGESGPCFGDYGSGLVLFNNSTGRYHLRGVLSTVSVRKYTSDDFGGCDFSKYGIYVDVAKSLQWIQQQISITQH